MPAASLEVGPPLTKRNKEVLEEWAEEAGITTDELLSVIVRDTLRRVSVIHADKTTDTNVIPFSPRG